MHWVTKLFAHGVVRWVVGTTVQTGVVVAAVSLFMSVSLVSLDSRMTDIVTQNTRIEQKLDAGIEKLNVGQVENSNTLSGYSERFNGLDREFGAIRTELALSLRALENSIQLIDPTAATPLQGWGKTYLAALRVYDGQPSEIGTFQPFMGRIVVEVRESSKESSFSLLIGLGDDDVDLQESFNVAEWIVANQELYLLDTELTASLIVDGSLVAEREFVSRASSEVCLSCNDLQ